MSSAVYGTPNDWFASHGWRVFAAEAGSDWESVTRALLDMTLAPDEAARAECLVGATRKGRGYLKVDAASHGSPHKMNSDLFWETKRPFVEKYGAEFTNFGGKRAGRPRGAAGGIQSEPSGCHRRPPSRPGAGRPPRRHARSDRRQRAGRAAVLPPQQARQPLPRRAALRRPQLSARAVRAPGDVHSQQGGARDVGCVGQRIRRPRVRPASLPCLFGGPGGVDECERIREAVSGSFPGMGGTSATGRRKACSCRRRSPSSRMPGLMAGMATVNSRCEPGDRVRRILGGVLDVRRVLVPQVRDVPAVQPARPRTARARRARCSGWPATPARRRPMTAERTSASSPPA